jgi:ubiquinone/menaquinone biosynthesis C-methylase UbiE
MIAVETIFLGLLIIFFGILVPILYLVYSFYYVIAEKKGAPYVPTSNDYLDEILKKVKPKKGQVFLELGSGDGRMVRKAVKEYGVKGIGVEYHPGLIWYSRFLAKLQKLEPIIFIRANLFDLNFSNANIIFSFLMPKTNVKLAPKILKECRKGTIIISQGFEILDFKKKQFGQIDRKLFSTYFYKL